MMVQKVLGFGLVWAIGLTMATTTSAQVFFTDTFNYPNGDLDFVSSGLWVVHSGTGGSVQVLNNQAIVVSPGSNDHNRMTGQIMGANDVWYYGAQFSVGPGMFKLVNPDYFLHLKDSGTVNFRARLATAPPLNAANDYNLEIWATSVGQGVTPWNGDFAFGDTLTCIVGWDNATGTATLWVNPTNIGSTNVSHTSLGAAGNAAEALALRQDAGGGGVSSEVIIDSVSIGTDFDEVLAAVSGGPTCLLGDVNQDGVVNLLDVQPFVNKLTMGIFCCEADINQDGVVNLLDVGAFVNLLGGG